MTVFGADFSHYDAPDTRAAVGEGFSFFTHKAGGDRNDADLSTWWSLMKPFRGNVLLGAYWVLYPGSPSNRADVFIARLDAACPGWRDGPFILQVDCEEWNGDPGTAPGKADIKAFCDRLRQHAPKLRPIVYAPKWVYGDSLKGLGYPLWASSYVTGSGPASKLYPGDTSSKWAAYSGQSPMILQFTSSATIAGQTTCDANAFRGTLAELIAWLAPGWSEDLEKDDMTKDEFLALLNDSAVADKMYAVTIGRDRVPAPNNNDPANPQWTTASYLINIYNGLARLSSAVGVAQGVDVDETAIASAVLAGLTPEVLAQAITAAGLTPERLAQSIPDDLAEEVVEALGARLTGGAQ